MLNNNIGNGPGSDMIRGLPERKWQTLEAKGYLYASKVLYRYKENVLL